MQRPISPIKDVVSLVKLFLLFQKEKPQIIHSITPKAGLLSMLAAKFAGVPIRMHTFTGLIFPSKKGAMQKILIAMDRLLCWAATDIYPEGEGVKKDLQKFKITHKPLKIIGNGNVNGIDLDYFNPTIVSEEQKALLKQELGISASDFVFVFVGRLVRDKGINELVSAFSKLKTQSSKLLLVGPLEQELDPLLPETLNEINNNPNIKSVGFQKDIRPFLAISNVFVFPSYREGFPNVVLQAGAMNLPSIVTNISGSNEIIIEGKNGTIISSKDTESLKSAMEKFQANSLEMAKMSSVSRQYISRRFEQSFVWNELVKEYQKLVDERL